MIYLYFRFCPKNVLHSFLLHCINFLIKNYKNIPVFPNPLYNFAFDEVTTIIPENYADNSYL